jgi:hypothetical protein
VIYYPQLCRCSKFPTECMAPEEMKSLIIYSNIILQIKAMKDMYLPEINEMYQKIATKLQQVF